MNVLRLFPQTEPLALRPYQHAVISAVQHASGRRRLLVAPTGAGKTLIAAELIRDRVDQGKRALFLAHRRELIHQARDKLAAHGVDAGIILAGEPSEPDCPVQVASIQTLWTRAVLGRGRLRQELPSADLIVLDEAHRARARSYRHLIEQYPDAEIVGLTATPCRGDERGLGNVFDSMVEAPQVQELIDRGYLVGTKVYAPSVPDLKGVKTQCGDYVESQLAERMNKAALVGDIVTHWHRLADRRKTVVFATGVAHSIHLRDEFVKSGVRAEHIDGKTPKDERDAILARLSRGEIDLITNCMVLTEGWDQPDVSCIVLARPTKHMGLYRQMVGRVLRPAPGKDFALVLDHAGAVFQHGFVEEPVTWTLDTDKRAESPVHVARGTGPRASQLVTCSECSAVRTAGKPCPCCGHMPRPRGRDLEVIDGDLARVDHSGRLHPHQYTPEQRRQFHRELLGIAQARGYKPGWAGHKYRERFGHWPPDRYVQPAQPGGEVLAWVRHCNIKFAKSQAKAVSHG